ncbi:hypothetical protein [Undibacterium terreum]|nr:hypothetical protein [Undibacterium terreum]
MRGIVSELPADFPFQITDPSGRTHRGVYALNVLVWNRGTQEISPSDFLDNAPLRLAVGKEAYIIKADSFSNDDQLACSAAQVDEQSVDIYFDCINPGDFLNIILFYGGKAMVDIDILGRIRGQAVSLDHQADEVKAGLGERLANFIVLLAIANMLVGLPISSWLIYRNYSFSDFFQTPTTIPPLLGSCFAMGIVLVGLFIQSRIFIWWERRKYPPGYPLHVDFEPTLIDNIKGMFLTVFRAKKQRLSASIFNWSKPVIMTRKKSKRLSVNDWIS